MFGDLRGLDPKNYHLSQAHHISKPEWYAHEHDIERYVRTKFQQSFADQIAHMRVQKTQHDYSVEYRADLYVFSPDEFWRIVEFAAMDLNRQAEMTKVKP